MEQDSYWMEQFTSAIYCTRTSTISCEPTAAFLRGPSGTPSGRRRYTWRATWPARSRRTPSTAAPTASSSSSGMRGERVTLEAKLELSLLFLGHQPRVETNRNDLPRILCGLSAQFSMGDIVRLPLPSRLWPPNSVGRSITCPNL